MKHGRSNKDWMQRRWLDFRNGHSVYLVFAIAFIQFVILTYTLAIERISYLKELFPSMWVWALVFVVIYVPAAILIGHLHRKFQIPTEVRQLLDANPFIYYVQPGREKLVHFPAYILDLKSRMQLMLIQNAMADAMEKISKDTGVSLSVIPRFDKSILAEYEKTVGIYQRLAAGESLLDILDNAEMSSLKDTETR